MIIQDMANKFGSLDATNQSAEGAISDYILNNLKGGKRNRVGDKSFMMIAIQAYAKMLQDNGVTVKEYEF